MYFELSKDIYAEYGVQKEPDLPSRVSFIAGRVISDKLPDPLIFESDFTQNNVPGHICGSTIPLFSSKLVGLLRDNGVDNIQLFPALIVNGNLKWSNYFAVNVIGLVDCVDMDKSSYTVIDPGDGVFPPLVDFQELVIDESRAMDIKLFRVPESPKILVAHESVVNVLIDHSPSGGWGATVEEIETS